MELLWQTLESGDLGDPVMGIVNTEEDHTNIVDIKRDDGQDITKNPLSGRGKDGSIAVSPLTRPEVAA